MLHHVSVLLGGGLGGLLLDYRPAGPPGPAPPAPAPPSAVPPPQCHVASSPGVPFVASRTMRPAKAKRVDGNTPPHT